MAAPLRIGVMLDNQALKRWELWCLQALAERDDVVIALAISNPLRASGETSMRRAWRRMRQLPRRLHEMPWMLTDGLDRRFARRHPSAAAMEDVDLAALATDIPVIEVEPATSANGAVQRFDDADIAAIRAYDLDILLRFGFNILKGPILSAARHGVWSFHHADNRVNRGMPPGFWEIVEDASVTGVTLQRLTEDLDNGRILARGWYPTDRTSWNRNHARIAARGRTLLTDAVGHVARHGDVPAIAESPVNIYCHPLYRKPSARTAFATAARAYGRPFGRKLTSALWRNQWHVRWGHADAANASLHRLHRLVPPPDRLWADPFACRHGDEVWLFVEELFYANDRGRIVALKVDGDRVLDHRVVMEPDFHLSYPFLFEHEGELYMIPESNENRSVELWRCTQFPDRWQPVHEILSGIGAADTTLLEHEGRWYLFTTLARNDSMDRSTELHIYHADSPLAQHWQPHDANPVVVDCRAARMAGGFLTGADGSLIRCAQYHGAEYGQEIVLRRVSALAPDEYAEATAGTVVPQWQAGLSGTHHLSSRDGIICVDACAAIPRWSWRQRRPAVGSSTQTLSRSGARGPEKDIARPAREPQS